MAYIVTGGTTTVFDSTTDYSGQSIPSNLVINTSFAPSIINNGGGCAGYSGTNMSVYSWPGGGTSVSGPVVGASFWPGGGSSVTALDPMEKPVALNDQNQVVGVTGTNGYLWTSGSTSSICSLVQPGQVQKISQLLQAAYRNQVVNINPIDISGSNAVDGSVRISFGAQYQTTSEAGPPPADQVSTSPGWSSGIFLLTLESGTQTALEQIETPPNASASLAAGILNAQGLIANTGTLSTTGTGSMQKALLLVPVQLKQTNYPTTADEVDPRVSGTEAISSGTTSNSVAYITGSAAMPMLQAEIANGSLSGMNVRWWMTVTSERKERGTQDNLQIPSLQPGYVTVPINQPWEIDDYFPEPFGGVCTIHYIIQDSNGNNLTSEQTFPFLIRGKNPTPTEAHNYIQAEPFASTLYYAWGVAKHESAQDQYHAIYCQFNAGGSTVALPNYGYPNGWGIFQRDDTGGGIAVTTDQVYSWKVNSDVAVQQELYQKWNSANTYLGNLQSSYPTQYQQDPPPTYTTGNGTHFAAVDALCMEAYNGAGRFSSLLRFTPSNSTGHRWAWHLPNAPKDSEPYVDRVAERMSTSP